jgi:external thioesterase TEII
VEENTAIWKRQNRLASLKPKLFIFHFAGGNAYSFRFLHPFLRDFDVIAPELPGRGRRIGEPLLNDFRLAVLDMYRQVSHQLTDTPVILYGHSLGAYLAFAVTDMLEKEGRPASHLLVSGNAGPGIREPRYRYLLNNDEFLEELKKLGGIPKEFLTDKNLFNFFEPLLRADFELAERNDLAAAAPVNTPLFALMGSHEEHVEQISNWRNFTRSQFDHELLEGDHFFIYQHANQIADTIRNCTFKTLAK